MTIRTKEAKGGENYGWGSVICHTCKDSGLGHMLIKEIGKGKYYKQKLTDEEKRLLKRVAIKHDRSKGEHDIVVHLYEKELNEASMIYSEQLI
jgi:hypothetical protein